MTNSNKSHKQPKQSKEPTSIGEMSHPIKLLNLDSNNISIEDSSWAKIETNPYRMIMRCTKFK